MIHIVTATYTEAKCIIQYYKLKKLIFIREFQIFYNKKACISLTISGIGKVRTAPAVSYTFCVFDKKKNDSWINIGIAGHEDEEIGEIFLVKKIIDHSTKKNWFPAITFNSDFNQKECKTFEKPNFSYSKILHDMELSAFYEICSRFSSNELIHSLKIVSDNKFKKDFNTDNLLYLFKKNILSINQLCCEMKKILSDFNLINNFNPKVKTK